MNDKPRVNLRHVLHQIDAMILGLERAGCDADEAHRIARVLMVEAVNRAHERRVRRAEYWQQQTP